MSVFFGDDFCCLNCSFLVGTEDVGNLDRLQKFRNGVGLTDACGVEGRVSLTPKRALSVESGLPMPDDVAKDVRGIS